MTEIATQITPVVSTVTEIPDFGNGRYSPVMLEVYNDSRIIFGLSSAKAEKLAHAIANELGAIMKTIPVSVKLGQLNKDGKLTITEACKLKGFTITDPITALKALHFANDAMKNGFNRNDTSWVPNKALATYLAKL